MKNVTEGPDKMPTDERHRGTSIRQELPIKLPLNSLKTIIVGTADPAEKTVSRTANITA